MHFRYQQQLEMHLHKPPLQLVHLNSILNVSQSYLYLSQIKSKLIMNLTLEQVLLIACRATNGVLQTRLWTQAHVSHSRARLIKSFSTFFNLFVRLISQNWTAV